MCIGGDSKSKFLAIDGAKIWVDGRGWVRVRELSWDPLGGCMCWGRGLNWKSKFWVDGSAMRHLQSVKELSWKLISIRGLTAFIEAERDSHSQDFFENYNHILLWNISFMMLFGGRLMWEDSITHYQLAVIIGVSKCFSYS